jgi:predicted RNase H-like HicB family nuclease
MNNALLVYHPRKGKKGYWVVEQDLPNGDTLCYPSGATPEEAVQNYKDCLREERSIRKP